jgi:hypothetical protein
MATTKGDRVDPKSQRLWQLATGRYAGGFGPMHWLEWILFVAAVIGLSMVWDVLHPTSSSPPERSAP